MRYNPALDGLRAVAIMMVIGYHTGVPTSAYGFVGVDVFFVLSGFLITRILAAEVEAGGIKLGAFYLRRIKRLYPALILMVGAMLALGWTDWKGALIVLAYLGDYVTTPGIFGHTWSLAVEEHYYLLWPLVVPFIARMPRRNAIWLLGALYVAFTLWGMFQPFAYRAPFRFDTRASGLIFGSLLAFLPVRSLLPFGLMLVVATLTYFTDIGYRQFAEAATGCFILLSYQMELPFLTRPSFVYIGRISYGLYLFHTYFQAHAYARFDMNWHGIFLGTFLPTLVCAVISYHTVEAWFRRPANRRYEAIASPGSAI